jgi:aminopeptidase N
VQAAEITSEETADRARLLRIGSYDVTLDLTFGAEFFRSTSVITFECTEPGAAIYADLIAEQVHEITLNGADINPADACAGGRITLAALAGRNELRVVADCRYSADGTGLHRSVDPADGRVYTYTKFEPAYARTVVANFEQPDLKAAFTIHVRVPAHWTVLSNQPALGGGPVADGKSPAERGTAAIGRTDANTATWHFEQTLPLPTYLFAVIAGEYAVVRSSHTTPRGQAIPLGLACRQSLADFQDADDIFNVTRLGQAGQETVPGLTVDADLRWAILRRLAAVGRARGADIDAELARLPRLWAARGGHLRVQLGEALFPRTAAGQQLIGQIDAFLAAGNRDPGLVRVLIERRNLIERALRSRALTPARG